MTEHEIAHQIIRIRGARENNLKNIDADVPHGKLTVVCGPSGSGKSSLAIRTIFAEGQRQYIETLSTYARQFVNELPRPDFDSIEGLQPTLCIDQHPSNNSPRSTVGTVTEIHDFLRVLMARAADVHCHQCGSPIRQMPSDRIVDWITELPEGTKAIIMAPLVRGRKGRHDEVIEEIRKAGLLRVRIDGKMLEVDSPISLNARQNHTIEAVADRIIVREGNEERIAESVDLALRLSDGSCLFRYQDRSENSQADDWCETLFSTRFACPDCDVAYAELEPKSFSFNSPYGACPTCEGLGWTEQFDGDMILDLSRPVNGGAIVPWQTLASSTRRKRNDQLDPFLALEKLEKTTPLEDYKPKQLNRLLYGNQKKWPGLLQLLEKELATCTSEARLDELESFRALVVCPDCEGSRLGAQARSASIKGQTIIDINRAPLDDVKQFFDELEFDEERADIGVPLAQEIASRLEFLCQVGLNYLTLDRPADSLSGGEYQRVRLASSIGSGLANVCYVLDEPTIGLHPADNLRLIQSIRDLKLAGNTVMVVEHDADMIRQADWVIDIGPGAGTNGGQVVFAGSFDDLLSNEESSTARFLAEKSKIQRPVEVRAFNKKHCVKIRGANANNLQNVDVDIPLGMFVCVTGVSGSGKSTLIEDTLTPAIRRQLGLASHRPGVHKSLQVVGPLDNLLRVDQKPIGRSARSNAATYTGIMDMIRKLFAATKDAKSRGYTVSRFSFNSKAGMCPVCEGYGQRKIEMNFLPNMFAPCEQCRGRRYNHQTLEVRYRDHSIADILQMSIADACVFFQNVDKIFHPLQALNEVGLGYLSLGQPSTTLSGGEAQRVKLATEISRNLHGHCLYLLDEPTTGLHFQDVEKLLGAIHRLVENDNSVIVIEHHMELVAAADWIIDLGPGGGQHGGKIVASGSPDVIKQVKSSKTGKFLP
ncbi:MAG: excinuclease ABC subunit UvrA [Planctomycetaceae bacterium]|nr:excinuclease ABC subunit UvrA [Planctomycetaceae bacterium]